MSVDELVTFRRRLLDVDVGHKIIDVLLMTARGPRDHSSSIGPASIVVKP